MDPGNWFSFIRLAAVCNVKTFQQNQGRSLVTYLSYQESSLQINIDHLIKVLLLHREQEPVLGDAGGVDDDVGGSLVFLQNSLETFAHRVRLGDISGHTVMVIRPQVLEIVKMMIVIMMLMILIVIIMILDMIRPSLCVYRSQC